MGKKEHLIVGYGSWGKKIFENIKKKHFFKRIYIKSRRKNYIFENKRLNEIKKIHNTKKFYSAHICTPLKKHFYYAKKLNVEKLIIEKPTFHTQNYFKNIKVKKKKIITNYSDLYSPKLLDLYRNFELKKKGIFILKYRNKTLKYKKNFECLTDWMDHPLSIILFFFKVLNNFEIINFKRKKVKKFICESLLIKFYDKNYKVLVDLNTFSDRNKIRSLRIKNKNQIQEYNFYKFQYKNLKKNKAKKIISSKSNSILNVYKTFLIEKSQIVKDDLEFSKKIFIVKNKIIKAIKENY